MKTITTTLRGDFAKNIRDVILKPDSEFPYFKVVKYHTSYLYTY